MLYMFFFFNENGLQSKKYRHTQLKKIRTFETVVF